ncbi:MAG: class I SAM-dependent methyltransferase [bacterium]|nr:class I SAM-dependent methyltransferase [bacterium]
MKYHDDAWGAQLLAQYKSRNQDKTFEIIEREDGYIAAGSSPGYYFWNYSRWSPMERRAIVYAQGRVLDVGCGAGRHSLYLQNRGFDVTGIDNSPGAIRVCKLRGLKKVKVLPVEHIEKFSLNSFDTVLMLGNNFGLFGNPRRAKVLLKKMYKITSPKAKIIVENRNPYKTNDSAHLQYHKLNKRRGRMPGQIRMRVRFDKLISGWFDYLFVSPQEMQQILKGSGWRVKKLIVSGGAEYFSIIVKS